MDAMLLMLLLSSYRDQLGKGDVDALLAELNEAIDFLQGQINKPGPMASLPGFTPERRF